MSLVRLYLNHARILKTTADHVLIEDIPDYVSAYARRLRAWAEESASEGERLLVGGLRRDPAALAHKLTQVEVLAGYPPQVGQRILGPEYDYLAALRLDLSGLGMVHRAVKQP